MASRWISIVLVIGAFGTTAAHAFEDGEAPGRTALLERLKDRDAQFDGRSIETEQRWVERVSPRASIAARRFDAHRFGQPDPGPPPDGEIPADYDQPHRLRKRLTTRGVERTIERLGDEPMKHPEYTAILNVGCRWSSAGGVERVWSPATNDLHVMGPPALESLLHWDAHAIRWCCGYGFAEWITAVESVEAAEGWTTVKGRMRLMDYDDTRFEIALDPERILRRAVLRVPPRTSDGFSEYVVETTGTIRPGGCPPVAQSGRFRRTLRPKGKPESVVQDDEIRFLSISSRLSDEQYAARTRIEPGPEAVRGDAFPRQGP